ncbi:hypothetical protein UPYG_G00218160 [Umbra pygmaea]|uniref:Uncharacterized protein n=1 Tax=Umbra pygmaea TaxID=75934 RepID=A0ABD0WL79_UMBPY
MVPKASSPCLFPDQVEGIRHDPCRTSIWAERRLRKLRRISQAAFHSRKKKVHSDSKYTSEGRQEEALSEWHWRAVTVKTVCGMKMDHPVAAASADTDGNREITEHIEKCFPCTTVFPVRAFST